MFGRYGDRLAYFLPWVVVVVEEDLSVGSEILVSFSYSVFLYGELFVLRDDYFWFVRIVTIAVDHFVPESVFFFADFRLCLFNFLISFVKSRRR